MEKLKIQDFKLIELEDKEIIEKYFKANVRQNSDYSFANVFMWSHAYNIRYTIFDEALVISVGSGKDMFLTPPYRLDPEADLCPYMKTIHNFLMENTGKVEIRAVSEVMKEKLFKRCSGGFDFFEDRDSFEYIYSVNELITLSGKKYHGKKNHLNKFLKTYEYEYAEYCDEYFDECMEMQEEWSRNKEFTQQEESTETGAIRRALINYKELGLKGCVIKIDGKIAAFSFGTALNENTAVILIEKASGNYQGIYQVINRDFLRYAFYDMEFVNRQEDMGDEGLRRAKMTYNPVAFAEKYIMRPKA